MTHFCNKSLRGTDCCSPYDAIIAMINNAQATADAALALAGNVSTNLGILMSTVATAIARLDALGSVMTYKGSVATYADLPATGNEIGDTYNVIDTGENYAWTGSAWDMLGSVVDLSPYLKITDAATTYLTITNAASTYLTIADASSTYLTQVSAASTYLTQVNAASTYLTIANAATSYVPKTGGTFSGAVNVTGNFMCYDFNYAIDRHTTYTPNKVYVGTGAEGTWIRNRTLAEFKTDIGLDTKQDTLVSGTNIKTINNNSILGIGDLSVGGFTYTAISTDAEVYTAIKDMQIGEGLIGGQLRLSDGNDRSIQLSGIHVIKISESISGTKTTHTFLGSFQMQYDPDDVGSYTVYPMCEKLEIATDTSWPNELWNIRAYFMKTDGTQDNKYCENTSTRFTKTDMYKISPN